MTTKTNRIITIGLALLFILSFLMPALQGPLGMELNGFSVFGANIATVVFVEGLSAYLLFLFTALTNVWVVLLLIWSGRSNVKPLPTLILSLLAVTSALSWKFNMEGDGVLLMGYWLWVISIVLIISFTTYRSFRKPATWSFSLCWCWFLLYYIKSKLVRNSQEKERLFVLIIAIKKHSIWQQRCIWVKQINSTRKKL